MHCKFGVTIVNLIIALAFLFAGGFVLFHKLFAISADVKALEVEREAGKWNKMHLAYALENEKLGSFKEIGYVPFGEILKDGEASKSKIFSYSSDLINGRGRFLAINRVTLAQCRRHDGQWFAYINPEQIIGNAVAESPVERCAVLLPNFELLRGEF